MSEETARTWLELLFPELKVTPYQITSERTEHYNCVAYVLDDSTRWWDPSDGYYWPKGIPREPTLDTYEKLFVSQGFERCEDAHEEPACEKIALYGYDDGEFAHVTRLVSESRWTSKLGDLEDIEHALEGLAGKRYGGVIRYLRRREKPRPAPP